MAQLVLQSRRMGKKAAADKAVAEAIQKNNVIIWIDESQYITKEMIEKLKVKS